MSRPSTTPAPCSRTQARCRATSTDRTPGCAETVGHRRGHLRAPDLGAHVATVDRRHAALDRDRVLLRERGAGRLVVERDAALERGERDRPVHRAGVEHLEPERATRPRGRSSTSPTPTDRRSRRRARRWRRAGRSPRTREPGEVVGELRIRRRHRLPAAHRALTVDRVRRDRGRHRDAMVAVALEATPARGLPPRITSPSLRVSTARPSSDSSWCTAPMRLLSFAASSAASRTSVTPSANAAATASAGTSSWTFGISSPSMIGGGQRARAHAQVADRLAAALAGRVDLDVGTHAAQHVDEAEPRRVQRQRLDREIGTGRDERADHEERGRRRIARHLELRTARARRPAPARSSRRPPPARRARRACARCGRGSARATRSRSRPRPGGRRASAPTSPARSRPAARAGCRAARAPRITSGAYVAVGAPVDRRAHRPQRFDDAPHRPLAAATRRR